MTNIGSWNIWGLNSPTKQKVVRDWIYKHSLGIIGLLETKIAPARMNAVISGLALPSWKFLSNVSAHPSCRILVGWDPLQYDLVCSHYSEQWVTCDVITLSSHARLRITFVYGLNNPSGRGTLWNYIQHQAPLFSSSPWALLGDFNAILRTTDRSGGDASWYGHMEDFGCCINDSELSQISYSGMKYTWHNGQLGNSAIMKKLDWIFGNSSFLNSWPTAHSQFLPRDHSDHSSMVLTLSSPLPHSPSPFKFLNVWADREDFLDIVKSAWESPVHGTPIYSFTTKLRLLKHTLKSLHRHHTSHISNRVAEAKHRWTSAQILLDESPASEDLLAAERNHAKLYSHLCKEEEAIYKQRSRIQWLHLGDRNTKFFHRSLMHRQSRNNIHALNDEAGNQVADQKGIGQVAVSYFQKLLSATHTQSEHDFSKLFPLRIPASKTASLVQPITDDEIKMALFSIPDNKAPGPDGFTALFFKRCWHIIGVEFIAAIKYCFRQSSIPCCVNTTRIALVPKVENPACMDDYRPISCCNVMYKCISKVIASRLKIILPDVIGPSQSAFIPGRQISDNILLSQELLHNYHLNTGSARCALKVDLKKAFDTISWNYILMGLKAVGIPDCMVKWIQVCISSAHFSVGINGKLHGFFQSSRGLRQGDPLSPYLFVLVMEGLGGLLGMASSEPTFRFHWRCKQNKITHLSFADDVMIFCNADIRSVQLIREALASFSRISGLTINRCKSSVFLSGVEMGLRTEIINCLGFNSGTLPVKYLGVPLISTRLTHQHCMPLIERITSRIKNWTTTSLTYAGRLQLIKSTLFSIQVYWSSMFLLPCHTIRKIESILAAFLWKGTSLNRSGAKVAWASLCYPLKEGGLGIKSIRTWNNAAVLKHVWRLHTESSSVWVEWVHSILLRGRCFWYINPPSTSSWSWRKILLSRTKCKGMFTSCIGNGKSTSLWLDYWLPDARRFCDILPFRVLNSTGLPWNAKVSDIISEGRWSFPTGHLDLQTIWNSIHFQPRTHLEDHCKWQGHPSGKFTIDSAWDFLRDSRPTDTMYHLIWFPEHVPRQAFILWIASMGRLHTMDRLLSHQIISSATCALCGLHTETHNHLFFQCTYSASVWRNITEKTLVNWPNMDWLCLLQWAATTFRKKKDFSHYLSRLALSVTIYFLWYERNNRIFSQIFRSGQQLSEEVFDIIRSCLLNKNPDHIPEVFKSIWKLPGS